MNIKAFGMYICSASLILFACNNNDKKQTTEPEYKAFDVNQLDTTVSPCEDFYQFANGNWLKENPVPSDESRWGTFNILDDEVNEKLKAIVEELTTKDYEKGSTEQLVGDFYKSALDTNKQNENGINTLQKYLAKIDEASSVQAIFETMANLKRVGSGTFFGYYVYIDSKNSNQYITYISQGGIGLPDRDYYFPDDEKGKQILADYQAYIQKTFELTGIDASTAKNNAQTVVDIETQLAKNSMDRVSRRDPLKTYNKFAFEELSNLFTKIDWNSFIAATGLEGVDSVIVSQPDFLKGLNKLVEKYTIDDWKTYMKWHLINDLASYVNPTFEKHKFSFYSQNLRGISEMKPLWERALDKVNSNLGEPLGKLFVAKHFPESSKQKVLDLIKNIQLVFEERVQKLDWMSEETKKKALEKLSKFNYKIGYPDKWKDYSSITITADNLLENHINFSNWQYEDNITRLGKEIDKTEWGMTPQTINAYYSPLRNEIVFPAAILQPPFFDPKADDALNYGGIGGVIGHEFSHGFDDKGSMYDGNGNLNNWWTDEDRKKFEERTKKLVNQFNSFHVVDSIFVNGKLTLGENIADLAGLTLSYYALLKAYEGKEPPQPIDGFTYKQRFFLGWARAWHSNIREEEARRLAKIDPHSPTKYRVNGPLSNLNEFKEAFGCKDGDNMVVSDSLQVKIW